MRFSRLGICLERQNFQDVKLVKRILTAFVRIAALSDYVVYLYSFSSNGTTDVGPAQVTVSKVWGRMKGHAEFYQTV